MNKNDFLTELRKKLSLLKVADIEDIIAEYEQHFNFKLADGYSEEEIAVKLGHPEELAQQFATAEEPKARKTKGNKALAAVGLSFADILVAALFILLYGLVVVLAALAAATCTTGVCLALNIDGFGLIPSMPYGCALIYAIAFMALSVLSVTAMIYCFLYIRQLGRAYRRWHKNVLALAGGKPVYPALATHPRISPKFKRRLRRVTLVSLTMFAVGFIAGYIVCALSAGAFEYWHTWSWFVK
jgi:uncharacterized membrane protein